MRRGRPDKCLETEALREAAQLRAERSAARDARIRQLAAQGLGVAEIRLQTGFSHSVVVKAVAQARGRLDGKMAALPPTQHGGEATG
jgi:hypothetical protein